MRSAKLIDVEGEPPNAMSEGRTEARDQR